jgi:hypothetical protein
MHLSLHSHTRKVTTIIEKLSNTSKILKCQIYNNTTSISSRHGSSAHGHLGIVPDTVQYMAVSNMIPWFTPKHPVDAPNLAPGITAVQHKQITCQFDSDLTAYEIYHRMSNRFKQKLLQFLNDTFFVQ